MGPDAGVLAREHGNHDAVAEIDALASGDTDHPLERDTTGLEDADRLVAADDAAVGVGGDRLGTVEVVEVRVADDDPVTAVDVRGADAGPGGAGDAVDVGVEHD